MPRYRKDSIALSPKHGVNPCMLVCFFCGGEKNEIALLGKLKGDKEAPRYACIDRSPCDLCKERMKEGILFIEVASDEETATPVKTGNFCVVKEDAVRRIITLPELAEKVVQSRVAFLPRTVWKMIGLPTQEEFNDGSESENAPSEKE